MTNKSRRRVSDDRNFGSARCGSGQRRHKAVAFLADLPYLQGAFCFSYCLAAAPSPSSQTTCQPKSETHTFCLTERLLVEADQALSAFRIPITDKSCHK